MSIVSSTHLVGHAQADGRHYVVETHTDHLGAVYRIEYGPVPAATDFVAVRTARAGAIEEQLAQQEFEDIVGGA